MTEEEEEEEGDDYNYKNNFKQSAIHIPVITSKLDTKYKDTNI